MIFQCSQCSRLFYSEQPPGHHFLKEYGVGLLAKGFIQVNMCTSGFEPTPLGLGLNPLSASAHKAAALDLCHCKASVGQTWAALTEPIKHAAVACWFHIKAAPCCRSLTDSSSFIVFPVFMEASGMTGTWFHSVWSSEPRLLHKLRRLCRQHLETTPEQTRTIWIVLLCCYYLNLPLSDLLICILALFSPPGKLQ